MRCVFQFTKYSTLWLVMLGEFPYIGMDFGIGSIPLWGINDPLWTLFTCVWSSRPHSSKEFLGKVLQRTQRLHSTKGRRTSRTVFLGYSSAPRKGGSTMTSVWSKTSVDAFPVWEVQRTLSDTPSSKAASCITENGYPALCLSTCRSRAVSKVD